MKREFKCTIVGYEDGDPKIIIASDAQEAAELRAERYDQDDYAIMRGKEIEVVVEEVGSKKTFLVMGEAVSQYHATELDK